MTNRRHLLGWARAAGRHDRHRVRADRAHRSPAHPGHRRHGAAQRRAQQLELEQRDRRHRAAPAAPRSTAGTRAAPGRRSARSGEHLRDRHLRPVHPRVRHPGHRGRRPGRRRRRRRGRRPTLAQCNQRVCDGSGDATQVPIAGSCTENSGTRLRRPRRAQRRHLRRVQRRPDCQADGGTGSVCGTGNKIGICVAVQRRLGLPRGRRPVHAEPVRLVDVQQRGAGARGRPTWAAAGEHRVPAVPRQRQVPSRTRLPERGLQPRVADVHPGELQRRHPERGRDRRRLRRPDLRRRGQEVRDRADLRRPTDGQRDCVSFDCQPTTTDAGDLYECQAPTCPTASRTRARPTSTAAARPATRRTSSARSGKTCNSDADCQSGGCDVTTKLCVGQCQDGIRTATRPTSTAAAAPAPAAPSARSASSTTDCLTRRRVQRPPSDRATPAPCKDGIKDGTETDVDCGGATCDAAGEKCGVGHDVRGRPPTAPAACCTARTSIRASANVPGRHQGRHRDRRRLRRRRPCDAAGKTCAVGKACGERRLRQHVVLRLLPAPARAPTRATTATKDGNETDVDCGGATCDAGKPCAVGQECLVSGRLRPATCCYGRPAT